MKRAIHTALLLTLTFLVFAQGGVPIATSFKSGYCIVGVVNKKSFPVQNNLSIVWNDSSSLQGILLYDLRGAIVDGVYRNENEEIEGSFLVWNNKKKELVAKSNEFLMWEPVEVKRYNTTIDNYSVSLVRNKGDFRLSLESQIENNPIISIDADIPSEIVEQFGFFAIDSLIRNCGDIQIIYSNGQEFNGKAKLNDDFMNHSVVSGCIKKVPADNVLGIKFHKGDNDSTLVEVVFNGEDLYKSVQYKLPNTDVAQEGNMLFKSLISNTKSYRGIVSLSLQRTFYGIFDISYDGGPLRISLKNGTIKYANGDWFEGNVGGIWVMGIPVDGIAFFADGTQKSGDWISSLNLSKYDQDELAKATSLTEFRMAANEMEHHNSRIKKYSGKLSEGPAGYYWSGRSLEAVDGMGKYSYFIDGNERVMHGPYSFSFSTHLSSDGKDRITVTGYYYNDFKVGTWRLVHKSDSGLIKADLNDSYNNDKLSGPFSYVLTSDGFMYAISGQYSLDQLEGPISIVFHEGKAGFSIDGTFDNDGWADGTWTLTDKKSKEQTIYIYNHGALVNKVGTSNVSVKDIFVDKYEPLPQYKRFLNAFK